MLLHQSAIAQGAPNPIAGPREISNPTEISIEDEATADPFGSEIVVSGLGVIRKVSVRLNSLSHQRFDDVGILLVGPTGARIRLATDTGGGFPIDSIDLTIDSSAPYPLPDNDQIFAGSYRPAKETDEGGGKIHPADFPATAPLGPYDESLTSLTGTNPNGVWRLYVDDDSAGMAGSIANGWTLIIDSIAPTPAVANICGRVITNDGRGIGKAYLMINGGYLSAPLIASSNPFGYFCFADMYVGQTYMIAANSKRYRFKKDVHFAVLLDEINDIQFVAVP